LKREYPVNVEWWPFELHPETPPEGRDRGPASGRPNPAIEAAHAAGIPMVRTSVIANSRLALEASEFARDAGVEAFDRFHSAVFHAYFEQDRNIGAIETLVSVGEAEGLDGTALRTALIERRYSGRVDQGIQWAADRGLTSTPFFIFVADRLYGVPGAQEYPVFESVMARLGVERRT
jgi:predicted DsbA family dithiol-disulfide isomerase